MVIYFMVLKKHIIWRKFMGAKKLDELFLRCKHRDRFKGKLVDFSEIIALF